MGRLRSWASDWLVVVVPLGVALLALAGYFAWRWYQDSHTVYVYEVF